MANVGKPEKKKLVYPPISCVVCGQVLTGKHKNLRCYCDICRTQYAPYDAWILENLLPAQMSVLSAAIVGQLAHDHRDAIRKWRKCYDADEKYQAWCTVRGYHHTWCTQWIGLMLGDLNVNTLISAVERTAYNYDTAFAYGGVSKSVMDFKTKVMDMY